MNTLALHTDLVDRTALTTGTLTTFIMQLASQALLTSIVTIPSDKWTSPEPHEVTVLVSAILEMYLRWFRT